MDRIEEAAREFRRRSRRLAREMGLPIDGSTNQRPFMDHPSLLEGLDASPGEIINHVLNMQRRGSRREALLTKWALSALATEMAMHETNSQLSSLRSFVRRIAQASPDDRHAANMVETATRLYDNFQFLSRFTNDSYSGEGSPRSIMESIRHEFARPIHEGYLVVETTPAFEASGFKLNRRVATAVFNNLVRNALQIGYKSGRRPTIVRLDARVAQMDGEWWDEEKEISVPSIVDTPILIVEDNGPGVSAGMEEDIFEPAVSGRNSTGIGLHLCRAVLDTHASAIVLANRKSELGGAVFEVGHRKVLAPDEKPAVAGDLPPEAELARALESMTLLVANGHAAETASFSEVYGDASAMALRIRMRGAENPMEERLVAAVGAFDEAVREFEPRTVPDAKAPAP